MKNKIWKALSIIMKVLFILKKANLYGNKQLHKNVEYTHKIVNKMSWKCKIIKTKKAKSTSVSAYYIYIVILEISKNIDIAILLKLLFNIINII